jgi:predicted  nucleic acid-binding Zn-ribbon protein
MSLRDLMENVVEKDDKIKKNKGSLKSLQKRLRDAKEKVKEIEEEIFIFKQKRLLNREA